MNTRAALQAAIIATPGLTLRELAAAVGQTSRANITGIAAQLSQLCKIRKLRKDGITGPGRSANPRYWPTDLTGLDLRTLRTLRATQPAPAAPAPRPPKVEKPAHVLRPAPARPGPQRSRPTPAQQFTIRSLAPPRTQRPPGATHRETVDEFIARGGRVQVLDPYATSNPLRFDHGNTGVHTARRRAVANHRKSGAL